MNTSMLTSRAQVCKSLGASARCNVVMPRSSLTSNHKVQQRQRRSIAVRAADNDSVDVDKIVSDLQQKWDKVENKTTVLVYAGGSIIALWLSSSIVGAVNAVPLLPKLLELVGLGYTSWFIYRYLLFKSNRQELLGDIDELKRKISGTTQETADTINIKAEKAKSKAGL